VKNEPKRGGLDTPASTIPVFAPVPDVIPRNRLFQENPITSIIGMHSLLLFTLGLLKVTFFRPHGKEEGKSL